MSVRPVLENDTQQPTPSKRQLRRFLPWLLSLAIVVVLFANVDFPELRNALSRADFVRFLSVIVLAVPIVFVLDALILRLIFQRLIGAISIRDMVSFKAVSHFGQALTFVAAPATMAGLIQRKYKYGFRVSFSAFLFQMAVDVIGLIVLITVGLAVGAEHVPEGLRDTLRTVLAVGWILSFCGVGFWVSGIAWGPLGRLRRWHLFEAFRRAKLADYLVILLARLCLLTTYACIDYLAVRSFGIETPFGAQQVYTALIAFAIVVPGTVSGLGAVQPVLIALYSPHVVGSVDAYAQVLAFSTVWGPTVNVCRIAIAYFFLNTVAKSLQRAPEGSASEEDDPPATAGSSLSEPAD